MLKWVPVCAVLLAGLITAKPSYAATGFIQGGINLIELLKYVVIIACLCGIIHEMFTKRNILLMLGLLGVTALVFYQVDPVALKTLGHKIMSIVAPGTPTDATPVNPVIPENTP